MSEQFDFDFDQGQPTEVKIRFQGKNWTLREASEETAVKMRGMQLSNARVVGGQLQANVDRIAESQAFLVSRCLFDDENKPVKVEVIRSWPSRVVKPLFERCKEMSGLAEQDDQPALEKRFVELVGKLGALAATEPERQQWAEWMIGAVHDKLAITPLKGSAEEAEKNSSTVIANNSESLPASA
jgi:hypothetical protein